MAVTIRVRILQDVNYGSGRGTCRGKDSRHVKNAPVPPARRTMTLLGLIPIAGLLVAAAPVQAQAVTVARAAVTTAGAAHSGQVSSLCRRYQHFAVATTEGSHFVVKNDNYGGQRECLAVQGERPNFTVMQSQLPAWHAKPQAYPFILRGCSWGTCSAADTDLPKQVSALQHPVATWYTTQVPKGEWDAAFDIWFGTRPMTTGQADGAEIMIWLNARRIPVPPRTPVVHVGHVRFYLLHWRACHRRHLLELHPVPPGVAGAAGQATAPAPLHPPCAAARLDPVGLVAGEHRGRVRALAGRRRAGHRLVLGPGLMPR